MKAARLFSILGLLEEDLIQEAAPDAAAPQRKRRRFRTVGLAACCALICGALLWGGSLWMNGAGSDSSITADTAGNTADAGEPGAGASSSESESEGFLSYAGPVLPLTTLETGSGLTAERTLTWNFAPGTYEDGSPRQWGAQVTDRYRLTNPTDADITVTALYPITGSLADLAEIAPSLTVDGAAADGALYAGGLRRRIPGRRCGRRLHLESGGTVQLGELCRPGVGRSLSGPGPGSGTGPEYSGHRLPVLGF